jgi:cytochrome P450
MMEAVLLLATIATRFTLRVVDDQPIVAVPSFTLRPKNGIRMEVNERFPH